MRKNLAHQLNVERNAAAQIKSISGETVTVPAGAAGSIVVAQLGNYPVRNSSGNDIGGLGDTSLVLTSSTAFTTEVYYEKPDASLANGEYWVDYTRGELRGKKASTSTTATAAYKIALPASALATQADGSTNTQYPLLVGAEAQDPTALPTATTAGKIVRLLTNLSRILLVSLADRLAGEDLDEDVMKVEQRYTRARATADALLVTGSGHLHTITVSPLTATPTAGLLTVYDNTAESGTVLYSEWIFATAQGKSILLDVSFGTGIYVGFDGTLANVACGITYRQ